MFSSKLDRDSRQRALDAMSDEDGLDILVVGGGVTGAGTVLDAATRGLRVGIVEMQDWAQGTSSRSSRLVHGGLRYLYQLDFSLVAEALHERGLLMKTTAPHLVKPQSFLWPLKMPVIERAYSAIGVGMYDALSIAKNRGVTVPTQEHLSRAEVLEDFPDVDENSLVGAIRFYDCRVDDARLVVTLIRTAASYGAYAANRAQVVRYLKNDEGRICGAVVRDLETGKDLEVKARHVINCTGVWTEQAQDLAGTSGGLEVLASKGIHLLFERDRIKGQSGIFSLTEKSVLFIIPWQRFWIVGTTDTPWKEDRVHPVATSADIDYVLEHANAVLSANLTRDDIIGVYAGLRPLLQPGTKDDDETKSTKVSREHTVTEAAPGLSVIAGGKLTSYRRMAEDVVDFVMGPQAAELNPSPTAHTPLWGAEGLDAMTRITPLLGARYGWGTDRLEHLLSRYGGGLREVINLIEENPELAKPMETAPAYLKAEVAFAASHEGALHLEDIVNHRVRLASETPDRGLSSMQEICDIAAPILGWNKKQITHEMDVYRGTVEAELEAMKCPDDATASQRRVAGPDIAPLVQALE